MNLSRRDRLPSRSAFAALYVACGLAFGTISFALGQSKNLLVFRHASSGMLEGRDLYAGGFVDYFKYSPTFALLFAPLAALPIWLTAAVWCGLNFGVAFLGLDAVVTDQKKKRLALAIALPGVLLATDGDQANLLVAGLVLASFALFERQHTWLGAGAVVLGALIKIFPLAAAALAIFHRDREKSALRLLLVLALGVLAPLAVLRPSALAAQYASWWELLQRDHANRGWSLVTTARDAGLPGIGVQIAAACVICGAIALGAILGASAPYRRMCVASLLVGCVLFNHRAEYCSFVLSAIGVALWYVERPVGTARRVLVALASIAHGPFLVIDDPSVRGFLSVLAAHRVYHPIRLLPLTVVWGLLQVDLVRELVGVRSLRSAASPRAGRCPSPHADRVCASQNSPAAFAGAPR